MVQMGTEHSGRKVGMGLTVCLNKVEIERCQRR
jgi:hypothetical protein